MCGLLLHTGRVDNPVAFYELSAKITGPKLRKPTFWIGAVTAVLILASGTAFGEPAAKKKTTARRKPVYSAERSLTRQAKLARARAALMAHEMATTPLPRYKVDASGDLVPDVRAAAAI